MNPVKPSNSRVIITKKANYLEIFIPPKGFDFFLFPMIFLNGYAIHNYSEEITTWNEIGWGSILFSSIFFGIIISWLSLGILSILFLQVRLCIDEEKISWRYELLGLKFYYPSPSPRQQAIKIEQVKSSYKENSDGEIVQTKPYLHIHTETQKFTISGKWLLSEIELDWLAYEVSQWLNLPITKTY